MSKQMREIAAEDVFKVAWCFVRTPTLVWNVGTLVTLISGCDITVSGLPANQQQL